MLFNLFGKKEEKNERIFKDVVWIDAEAKNNALLQLVRQQPGTLLVAWFPDAAAQLRQFLEGHGVDGNCVVEAKTLTPQHAAQHTVVFVEHYPLHEKELALAEKLHLQTADVHGALDEPIFVYFGSEKMLPMIKMLGFKASDPIRHAYVTTSVIKAQEKMAAKVTLEQSATSLGSWIEKNLPPRN
jgi:sulfite reductase alpha subunit-like flavoprotein